MGDEIHKSLDFMSEELSRVAKQQSMLLDLVNEVKQLKILVKEKDRKIEDLDRRINDMEQYLRMEDVIISRRTLKPEPTRRPQVWVEVTERSTNGGSTITRKASYQFPGKQGYLP